MGMRSSIRACSSHLSSMTHRLPVSPREASHFYKMGVGPGSKRTRDHDASHANFEAKEEDQRYALLHAFMRPLYE